MNRFLLVAGLAAFAFILLVAVAAVSLAQKQHRYQVQLQPPPHPPLLQPRRLNTIPGGYKTRPPTKEMLAVKSRITALEKQIATELVEVKARTKAYYEQTGTQPPTDPIEELRQRLIQEGVQ